VDAAQRRWTRLGWWTLAIVAAACVLSSPWTFGRVRIGNADEPRYAASNLNLNQLPPAWMELSSEEADRVESAVAAGDYVPGRLLGTDVLGRDVFARVLAGGLFSMLVGFSSAAVAVVIGTAWGAAAGFAGGRVDAILMRIVDVLYGLPSILLVVLLAIAVEGLVGRAGERMSPGASQAVGLAVLLIAIGGTSWQTMSRVVRGQVLSLRSQPFMESCRAVGVPASRQFLVHVLPNLVGTIAVYATLAVPAAILSESFLSFLGIGVREPLPSWGNLASAGLSEVNLVRSRWWLLAAPCALIAVTLVALNFIGDSLRARFDPTASRARW
jgi:ABC-type dipeptide/oligopeptide/nickel transport system permease subunit